MFCSQVAECVFTAVQIAECVQHL